MLLLLFNKSYVYVGVYISLTLTCLSLSSCYFRLKGIQLYVSQYKNNFNSMVPGYNLFDFLTLNSSLLLFFTVKSFSI
ncbi:hypothetical protein Zm00014a_026549 [Zea mays]|uniref:Uncharacterized protein n=1 Tax=Zea mays TaxID=4577 RepID=A0A317Y314_MAIZE|nr:hypothetical protein Zm00014a_026549 [Zea mays]